MRGIYTIEHWRRGQQLSKIQGHNAVPDASKDFILNCFFNGGTQYSNWYVGADQGSGVGTFDVLTYETLESYFNFDELLSYTDTNNSGNATTRPLWNNGAPSGESISSSSPSVFTITEDDVDFGRFFLCAGPDAQTKGDYSSGNILWNIGGLFGGPVFNAQTDDVINLSLEIEL